MKDRGLDKGLIQTRDTSSRKQRGWGKAFFGFRKMFWDYLPKLNVPFIDCCCEDAGVTGVSPVRYNSVLMRLEYFSCEENRWLDIPDDGLPTTTTTTTSTTTTTTEIIP